MPIVLCSNCGGQFDADEVECFDFENNECLGCQETPRLIENPSFELGQRLYRAYPKTRRARISGFYVATIRTKIGDFVLVDFGDDLGVGPKINYFKSFGEARQFADPIPVLYGDHESDVAEVVS